MYTVAFTKIHFSSIHCTKTVIRYIIYDIYTFISIEAILFVPLPHNKNELNISP